MANNDLYKILGVEEKASPQEIKKAYRKLAKENHPDAHPGDRKAEQRFKEISQAYTVLGDPQKRQKYDQMRRLGFPGSQNGNGFTAGPAGFDLNDLFGGFANAGQHRNSRRADFNLDSFFGFGGISDVFGHIFEGQPGFSRSSSVRDKSNIHVTLKIPFKTAAFGGKVDFLVPEKGNKRFSLQIPAATDDGKKLRLAGQGKPGTQGDLIATIKVAKHRFFQMNGLNIYCQIPLSRKKADHGTKIRVKTVHGKTVELKVPERTRDGRRFRLKGLGLKRGKSKGDQYVTIKVREQAKR